MYILEKTVNKYKVLACANEQLILSKGSSLYSSDLDLSDIKLICRIPSIRSISNLSGIRLLERILRLGISSFLILDEEWGLAVRKNEIWRINLQEKTATLDFIIPNNRKTLTLTLIKNINGFEDSIVFGEYFNNPSMLPVNIWSCPVKSPRNWSICFTFPQYEINHIHNIVIDNDKKSLWILAGDFGNGARICKASKNFESVNTIFSGKQQYRATWLHTLNDKKYYATDSQIDHNFLCGIETNFYGQVSSKLTSINGSSIYAATGSNAIFFSTAVEPGSPSGNLLIDLFERKIGNGIKSNQSVIYMIGIDDKIEELFRADKDIWPLRLAQFGTFIFPSGMMPDDRLYVYGCALKNFENATLFFKKTSSNY